MAHESVAFFFFHYRRWRVSVCPSVTVTVTVAVTPCHGAALCVGATTGAVEHYSIEKKRAARSDNLMPQHGGFVALMSAFGVRSRPGHLVGTPVPRSVGKWRQGRSDTINAIRSCFVFLLSFFIAIDRRRRI